MAFDKYNPSSPNYFLKSNTATTPISKYNPTSPDYYLNQSKSGIVLPNANLNSLSRLATNDYNPNTTTSSYQDTSGSGNIPGSYDVEGRIQELFDQIQSGNDEAQKELIELAKGDYDLVAKWLERAYTQATGTDDQARKDFILKVADDLEAKIGTIAYDYETGTYRTKEDMGIQSDRLTDDRSLALKRLDEDDKTVRKQYENENKLARINQGESLNQRGLLTGTRENTVGVGSNDVNQLEGDINDRFDALKRATSRTGEDINTSTDRGLADINLTGNRQLADLTTGARRGMAGASDTYQSSLEQAEAKRKARELEIQQEADRQRKLAKLQAEGLAKDEANAYYG